MYFQTGFLGIWGRRVDAIEYYKHQVKSFDKRVSFKIFLHNLLDLDNQYLFNILLFLFMSVGDGTAKGY